MTCSSMDDKRRVYDSIRFPQFFPGACACNVYQALSPPEGPGYEANDLYEYGYAASGIQKHYSPNKLDFSKGMRAVDQKLKINLVWPYLQ